VKRLIVAGITALLGMWTSAAFAVSPTAHNAPSAGVTHIGPDKVAWYDASRPTATAPPAPMAGVGPKDLVVAGFTINTALLPISLPIPPIRQVTDFVALSFKVPVDTSPASLTLHLAGANTASIDKHLPSGVTPIACPVTSPFKAGLQQPADAEPKYDCSKRSVVGQLTTSGKAVAFPGISRLLLTGSTLSVVILPGSLGVERLVFSTPTSNTLSLLSFATSTPITAPAVPPPSAPAVTVPAGPGKKGVTPIPPVPAATMPAPAVSQPVLAPTTPGLNAAALSKPDDHRERAAAIAMLVALIATAGWLIVTERGGHVVTEELGVGRFRSLRSGPPPTI
jgi:hypothetical protein